MSLGSVSSYQYYKARGNYENAVFKFNSLIYNFNPSELIKNIKIAKQLNNEITENHKIIRNYHDNSILGKIAMIFDEFFLSVPEKQEMANVIKLYDSNMRLINLINEITYPEFTG